MVCIVDARRVKLLIFARLILNITMTAQAIERSERSPAAGDCAGGCYTQPFSPTGKNAMSEKIVNIYDVKQHLTVNCGESVHVLPVSLIEDVINGEKCFTHIEGWGELIKPILRDWLNAV